MASHVHILPSGHAFTVEPGESVLDAGLRQGYTLPYGCRNGTCSACKAELKSGAVSYPEGPPPALTDPDAAARHVILCQARPDGDCAFEIREIDRADEVVVRTLPARLASHEPLAHDVARLRLRLPATERLQFLAGQYIDLLLRDGRRRSFSLANPPHADDVLELHVRRVPGGYFSEHLLAEIKDKAVLRFEGPLGSFYLREESERPIILMAGGTGFAPIKSIVEHAFARGLRRPIHLFWGVRAGRDLYLGELAQAWARDHEHIDFTPVLSEPAPEEAWAGAVGYVHEAVVAKYPDLSGHQVYMAGPPPMIAAARDAFSAAGLPPEELFFDSFDYAPDAIHGLAERGHDPGD